MKIGMGCSRLGAFWQGRSPRAGVETVAAARESGITFFDTADCYARGLSERVLGRALGPHRDAVQICTKVGLVKTPLAGLAARRAGTSARAGQCYAPSYVEWAVQRSLRRLHTDHLDVLLLHSPSADDLADGAAWPVLERLRDAGAIRRFGVSCEDSEAARAAVGLPGVTVLELPWSPQHGDVLDAVAGEARERGIAIIANRVLDGAGDARAEALRAAVANEAITVALVGMSRPEHVGSNVAAAS